jgi:hypothetical protein
MRTTPDDFQFRERFGYPLKLWKPLAASHVVAGVGILVGIIVRPLGIGAAAVLALVAFGETVARLTTRTWPTAVIPGVPLALALWILALWL